ncbi:hypothetical protein KC363_g2934 [Hortaea werneckii]|nr:hypothetical protein KC363_g2934 [Hortaea werneckii]
MSRVSPPRDPYYLRMDQQTGAAAISCDRSFLRERGSSPALPSIQARKPLDFGIFYVNTVYRVDKIFEDQGYTASLEMIKDQEELLVRMSLPEFKDFLNKLLAQ